MSMHQQCGEDKTNEGDPDRPIQINGDRTNYVYGTG